MKAVLSKPLAALLKQPAGREAVRKAVLAAVAGTGQDAVSVTTQVEGQRREVRLSVVPVRN